MSELYHDSAIKHVTGESVYVNDLDGGRRELAGHVVYSPHGHARILSMDISGARALDGVKAVITASDIPGVNQMGPVVHDELCLAEDIVDFAGQAVVLIAAESKDIAREAARLVKVEYETLPPVLTIEDAMEKDLLLGTPREIKRGDVDKGLDDAPYRISGTLQTGAQEHWYLETQSCLCIPGEDQEMNVYSSTQHPTETQAIVAEVLGVARNEVVVETRRMGGGFGGKETQANHVAAWAALLAFHTSSPVKIHLFRDDDQIMTGKRHPFKAFYEAGFDEQGRIMAYKVHLHSNAGAATDLSMAILERAVFHADNAYFIPHISVCGKAWKTNLPSNTAFRGFGGPQGMAVIENLIDRIARQLKMDSAEVRYRNFYREQENNTTHYGQLVDNNRLFVLYDKLIQSSDYTKRRHQVNVFNQKNSYVKRGLALTPVKFGISFTTSFLNQAGALVNIYQDGTVLVNHGGTEMGQGLHTKILEVACSELGLPATKIKVNATNTSKVPNTSPTAASSGSDLNGMAVKNAIHKLKKRLTPVAVKMLTEKYPDFEIREENIAFREGYVFDKNFPSRGVSFNVLIPKAYQQQVSLSATGFYKTPGIYFDKSKGKGKPFYYFAFGMAVAEVEVDLLTGHYKNTRTDILHDAGRSLNRNVDMGQVEGGFIQGVGWCTTEVIKWNDKGNILNYSPDNYKIPSVQDIPDDFRVSLLEGVPNPNTIKQSKAVGEPPFMLALSVWLAVKDAISAMGNHAIEPDFALPASNELILKSARKITEKLSVYEK